MVLLSQYQCPQTTRRRGFEACLYRNLFDDIPDRPCKRNDSVCVSRGGCTPAGHLRRAVPSCIHRRWSVLAEAAPPLVGAIERVGDGGHTSPRVLSVHGAAAAPGERHSILTEVESESVAQRAPLRCESVAFDAHSGSSPESTDPVNTSHSESTDPVNTSHSESTDPVNTSHSESTDPVNTSHSESTDPVNTSHSESTDPVNTSHSESTDPVNTSH
ncbi:hypothetical protein H8959_019374 [Pygathrix nigripes]